MRKLLGARVFAGWRRLLPCHAQSYPQNLWKKGCAVAQVGCRRGEAAAETRGAFPVAN